MRAARALAVCLLAVPVMLVAHLITARAVPPPSVAGLVAVVVFAVTAATGTRRRGRLALTVGLAQAAGHGMLAVLHPAAGPASLGGCLPMVGRGAELGLRFALLRHDATCPQGTLAAGPTTAVTAGALLTATLILVGHGLVAVLTALLVTTGHAALEGLRSVAALVGPPLRTEAGVPVAAPRTVAASPGSGRPLRPRWRPCPALRRGPPVVPVTAG
jgi:hypothetical protein